MRASRFDWTEAKTKRARRLRRDSTNVEARLWSKLRDGQIDGYSFRRQHPAGPYILDFYCARLCLAIELDGGQHNERAQEHQDRKRDAWLAERGVKTLRFWNSDIIRNLSGVLEVIKAAIEDRKAMNMIPTRHAFALRATAGDLPLSGGGRERRGRV
jgi:very-short-patch-repair endonuclease